MTLDTTPQTEERAARQRVRAIRRARAAKAEQGEPSALRNRRDGILSVGWMRLGGHRRSWRTLPGKPNGHGLWPVQNEAMGFVTPWTAMRRMRASIVGMPSSAQRIVPLS